MSKLIAKSSKGRREAGGKTADLPPHLRDVLLRCSGQFVAEELIAQQPPRERDAFAGALIDLIDGGYLRAVAEVDDGDDDDDAPPIESETADFLRADIAARRGQRDDETAEQMRQADELGRRRAEEARERAIAAEAARQQLEERARQEEEARAAEEAEELARREAEEAEREAIRERLRQRRVKQQSLIVRILMGVVGVALVLVILQSLPYDDTRQAYAKLAGDAIGIPVEIKRANLVLVGGPYWEFHDITVGTSGEGATITRATVGTSLAGAWSAPARLSALQLSGVHVALDAALRAMRAPTAGGALGGKVGMANVTLATPLADLPPLDMELAFDGGKLTALSAHATGDARKVLIDASRTGSDWSLRLNVDTLTLGMGANLPITDLTIQAHVGATAAEMPDVGFRAFDGAVQGKLVVDWSSGWHANADYSVQRMDLAKLAPGWLGSTFASGKGTLQAVAARPDDLLAEPTLHATFDSGIGVLKGIDLDKVIERKGLGEATRFESLSGKVEAEGGRILLTGLSLKSGAMVADADITLNSDGSAAGRIHAQVTTASTRLGSQIAVGGTRAAPKYAP